MKNILTLLMCLFLPFLSLAQEDIPTGEKLTHWLTPGELLRLDEIGRGFIETNPPEGPIRNIAEFDRMQGVLIRYPFGIPMALIKEMAEDITVVTIVASTNQQNTVLQQYISNGVDTSNCDFLIAPTDSYWTRDYGPWFVSFHTDSVGIVDFPYNRPRPNDDDIPKKVAQMLGIPWFGMNLIHTGGNYMSTGLGAASSTELVWEENPSLTPAQVDTKMEDYLGIDTYHVRPDPNGTYIDHIDCWAKFLAPDKILVRKVPPTHAQYQLIEQAAAYWAVTPSPYGYPYKVYRVNTPGNQPYTNSIILNTKVLMPFMNTSWDDSAKAVYESALPGYEVIGFTGNPGTPWESTDALHCRTMGIADIGILYIKHIPLSVTQPCETDYNITAEIIACSHEPLKTDSLLVYYSLNNGPYYTTPLISAGGIQYTATIPAQPAGTQVRYYLFAADESQRRETCPFTGLANPFEFTTIYTDITVTPDTLWFMTPEDALYGKHLTIHNYTNWPKTVQDIDSAGNYFWINPWPVTTFPHIMQSGDTLGMNVFVPLVTKAGLSGYFTDTLTVTSSLYNHEVIIMINEQLFNHIDATANALQTGLSAFPNPVRSGTNIRFILPASGKAQIFITDMNGKTVRNLCDNWMSEGLHTLQWDGRNEQGNEVPASVYMVRLVTRQGVGTLRLLVIR